jgi:hypothetical protein
MFWLHMSAFDVLNTDIFLRILIALLTQIFFKIVPVAGEVSNITLNTRQPA